MTLSAVDAQACALMALLGGVFAFGKALDVLVDVAIESLVETPANVAHHTYVYEGNRSVVTFFYTNGSGVERTTDFIGNCSTYRERSFVWRSDDRGVPREWLRTDA